MGGEGLYLKRKADYESGRVEDCLGENKRTQSKHSDRKAQLFRLASYRNGGQD